MLTTTLISAALVAALSADTKDPKADLTDPRVASAEEKYTSAVARATEQVQEVRAREAAKVLRVAKAAVESATRQGNLDLANAMRLKVQQYEHVAASGKAVRPENIVRFNGHGYALITEPATWHVAQRRCEEIGGHLVSIETQAELDMLKKLVAGSRHRGSVWIGATDQEEEGKWIWTNGLPVSPTIVTRFDDNQAAGGEHWAVMLAGGTLEDVTASWRLAYVCEWDN